MAGLRVHPGDMALGGRVHITAQFLSTLGSPTQLPKSFRWPLCDARWSRARGEACTRLGAAGPLPTTWKRPYLYEADLPLTFHSREKQGLCLPPAARLVGHALSPENGHLISGAWTLSCVTLRGDKSNRNMRWPGVQPGMRVTPHSPRS